MRKTTLFCDRCHFEVEEIFSIHLGVNERTYTWTIPTAEWCRECLVSTGVARWKSDNATPPNPEPTPTERLEEVIRTIVREEVEDASA